MTSKINSWIHLKDSIVNPIDPSVPVKAQDMQTLATHQKIKELGEEKAKQNADVNPPTLKNRITPPATPRPISRLLAPQSPDDSEETSDIEDFDDTFPSPRAAFSTSAFTDLKGPYNLTPPSSPSDSDSLKTTPKAMKDLNDVIDNNHPGFDLTPTRRNTLTSALNKIDGLPSPYRSQQKTIVRRRFGDALEKTKSTTQVPSPGVQRRLVFASTNCEDVSGKWTAALARSLDIKILDANHLKDLENQGGFHICGEGHPRDAFVRLRRTNLLTGVWCGQVCDSAHSNRVVKEFSSFIPRKMTLEKYAFLIAQAINSDECKIAQENNRRLYRIVDGDHTFVIECYFQEEGTRIRSAIPVFHYEVYKGTEKSFKVDYSYKWSFTGDDPLLLSTYEVNYAQLFELLESDPDAIIYNTDEKIIVDLGKLYNSNPKYGSCPIEQGLLVEISKKS